MSYTSIEFSLQEKIDKWSHIRQWKEKNTNFIWITLFAVAKDTRDF